MKEYYARICRNDNGWRKPSGSAKDGKNTFFGQYGFGMEEWLLDPRARIKGWQYGFLQPINKGYQQRKGSALALCLFSIPGGGFKKYREEFLIPHCEVLMPAQAEEAITTFRARLRIDKMVKQVKEVGGDPTPLLEPTELATNLVNVRFRTDGYQVLDGSRPKLRADYYQLYDSGRVTIDDEVRHPGEQHVPEGRRKKVTVNVRERNPKARKECLDKWGYRCRVCSMKFREVYGPIGAEFIHVHHLNPLSESKGVRNVNGAEDLRPVCPNCHAMLHSGSGGTLLTIKELKNYMRDAAHPR